jgi:hypothetical protein
MRIAAIAFAALMLAPAAVSAGSISYTVETDDDGNPQGGVGYLSSGFASPGVAIVTFAADVSNCTYVATLGSWRGKGRYDPGFAFVASGGGAKVTVYTTTPNGTAHDRPFHLRVGCPTDGAAPANSSDWAVVEADGSLARGSHVISASGSGGSYGVTFDNYVRNCVATATRGDAGTDPATAPGIVMAGPLTGHTAGYRVLTENALGDGAPHGFDLHLACGDQAGPRYSAVVGYKGALVRGIGATAAMRLAKGEYEVDFPGDVSTCSVTGSIGVIGTAGPSQPGMIDIAGRDGNANAILVQTFSKRSVAADRGFHVIVDC